MTILVYAHVHFMITKVRSTLQDDNIVVQRTLNENEYHLIYDKYEGSSKDRSVSVQMTTNIFSAKYLITEYVLFYLYKNIMIF